MRKCVLLLWIVGSFVGITASHAMPPEICDAIVYDHVAHFGILVAPPDDFLLAQKNLRALGVDLRIRSMGFTSNLDLDEAMYERQCPSWQSPSLGRKSTLLVLMVSTEARKMGIYYGDAWKHALEGHWNRIKNDIMGPHFRDGNFVGGLTATMQQLARRIEASQEEVLHPVVNTVTYHNTTVEEHVDYTYVWYGLYMLAGLFGLGGLCYMLFRETQTNEDRAKRAQQDAVVAHSTMNALLLQMAHRTYPTDQQQVYDALAAAYANFHMSGHGDPTIDGQTTYAYDTMRRRYNDMAQELKDLPYRRVAPQTRIAERKADPTRSRRRNEAPASNHSSTFFFFGGTGGSSPSTPGSHSSSSSSSGSSGSESGSSSGGGSSNYDGGSSSSGGGSSSYDSGSSYGGGGSSDYGSSSSSSDGGGSSSY